MKEFERALLEARPPDLPTEEFRRALRRDLLAEDRQRRGRRVRIAIGGLSAAVTALAAVLVLFVARPSLPGRLNASLLHDPAAREAQPFLAGPAAPVSLAAAPADARPADVGQLLTRAGSSATDDRRWIDELYEDDLEGPRVQTLEDERIFAVRRFQLTNGRSIVVYTEIGGEPRAESMTESTPVRDF